LARPLLNRQAQPQHRIYTPVAPYHKKNKQTRLVLAVTRRSPPLGSAVPGDSAMGLQSSGFSRLSVRVRSSSDCPPAKKNTHVSFPSTVCHLRALPLGMTKTRTRTRHHTHTHHKEQTQGTRKPRWRRQRTARTIGPLGTVRALPGMRHGVCVPKQTRLRQRTRRNHRLSRARPPPPTPAARETRPSSDTQLLLSIGCCVSKHSARCAIRAHSPHSAPTIFGANDY
jgi:hypothetical protein